MPMMVAWGAKITLPHLQRAAESAADFEEGQRPIHPMLEVTLIEREVMLPLVNQWSVIRQKI